MHTISMYIDHQNVNLSQSEARALLRFASAKGQLVCKKLYYNSQCSDQNLAKKLWESCALTCVDVPCPLKNSADNQLVADCISDNSNFYPNLFVIVSGDGDFLGLVNTLQQLNKKVIVIARKGNVKQKLIENANEFHFIDKLPEISYSDLSQGTQVVYEDAVLCLIEAIKIAVSRSQRTTYTKIDRLMRQNQDFPKYQGVSSICGRNGKKFTRFKQFIDAVAHDGTVRVQNSGTCQEVLLLKANQCAA